MLDDGFRGEEMENEGLRVKETEAPKRMRYRFQNICFAKQKKCR